MKECKISVRNTKSWGRKNREIERDRERIKERDDERERDNESER